ncbi:MAG: dihydroorotate dehydrogenase electron transfer subunit [Ignavibacteriae bacterium]|nr:dihydroorotate dehydrogenase electron transfer subunit [Ignavibacteria bacterium]MBI3365975.1 dihydroorotate dehydrogenase electron transfer subunit [Ignavibacteriota bacterium]
MIQTYSRVVSTDKVGSNILVLSIHSPEIARAVKPGQFINIKVGEWDQPLLRRPFSVYHTEGEILHIIFSVIGFGTTALSQKREGDMLDLIGPLGCPYTIDNDYGTAILVAGGVGVAPLPMLTLALKKLGRSIHTFLGARTRDQIVTKYLENLHLATDDGSSGFHGTVVNALRQHFCDAEYLRPKIFACGPNAMLRSLSNLAAEFDVPCEVSLESAMACGIGICQGCPIEVVGDGRKYALVCKEGTVFDTRTIRIS